MGFFESERFLDAVEAAYFKDGGVRRADVEVEGRIFHGLVKTRGRLVTDVPFLDYVEPLDVIEASTVRARKIDRAVLADVERTGPLASEPGRTPSPYVRWARFPSWEEYVAFAESANTGAFDTPIRKKKRLVREGHRFQFTVHTDDDTALARLFEWKSAQYRASGFLDVTAGPRVQAMFRHLRANGALVVSTIHIDDALVAAHAGFLHEGRFGYWLPAYDAEQKTFSPGSLLLAALLEHSYREGHREFDFLVGDERYKAPFTTHARIVGPLGEDSVVERAIARAKVEVKKRVAQHPGVYSALQRVKRKVEERLL